MAERTYDSYQHLANERSQFSAELQDPDIKQRLFSLTHQEVGNQGQTAQHAFIETVFNRAAARGQTLRRTMAHDYYPNQSLRYVPGANYQGTLDAVMGGSNVSGLATGNASLDVGFAGGPQTFKAGGERFGIEGPDRGWARATVGQLGTPLPAGAKPGAPKPGSADYWAQGKATRQQTQVASATAPKPAAQRNEAVNGAIVSRREGQRSQTQVARADGASRGRGRQRSNSAAPANPYGNGMAAQHFGGPIQSASYHEAELPEGDGEVEIHIAVAMQVV